MNKKSIFLILCLLPFPSIADDEPNWQLVLGEDPMSNKTACLMTSAKKRIDDGQGSTPVSIIYNGKAFIAATESNIDLSYADLGLQVDKKKAHSIDRLFENDSVVFEQQSRQILDEFIAGLNGRLTLGFWPTWPKTRAFTVDFDLRGFTRSYERFRQCQHTGKID
jgi:hypothetical protein